MKSTVRWHERAVSGALAASSGHLALERCVVRARHQRQDGRSLPAGLSAVLRDRENPVSGVPVGYGMTVTTAGGEQHLKIDYAAPKHAGAEPIDGPDDKPAASRTGLKFAASNERGNGSFRQGLVAGTENGGIGLSGRDAAMPPKALVVVERVMSKMAPISKVFPGFGTGDPAAADPLSAVLPGREKLLLAKGAAHETPNSRAMVTGPVLGVAGLSEAMADEQGGVSPVARVVAVSTVSGQEGRKRPGQASHVTTVATRSSPLVAAAGNHTTPLPRFNLPIDRVLNGGLDSPQSTPSSTLAGLGAGLNVDRFHDPAMAGQDVVPRRVGSPVQESMKMKNRGVARREEARAKSDYVDEPGRAGSATRSSSGPGAAPASQPGTVVSLRGDVMMDGRKMGRLVAVGQTSAASLPTVSGSAINLRALPIFAGTSAAL